MYANKARSVAENLDDHSVRRTSLQSEVERRFGILPNCFRSATSATGLIEELRRFAKSRLSRQLAFFKEHLFVQFSRFYEVRYCIIRHVRFLIGHGGPAGDRASAPS